MFIAVDLLLKSGGALPTKNPVQTHGDLLFPGESSHISLTLIFFFTIWVSTCIIRASSLKILYYNQTLAYN